MKVLMVSRRFPPDVRSGTETVFEALYHRAKQHHDVRLVAGFERNRDLLPEEQVRVDLRAIPPGLAHLRLWQAARGVAAQMKPDVVLSNSIEVGRLGCPAAVIVHDLNFGESDDEGDAWKKFLRKRLYTWRTGKVDTVIAPSHATAAELARIGCEAEVIHNGVDLERFRPAEARDEDETLQICCPGRILYGKGQHVAIDAIGRLSRNDKNRVHLKVVGAVADGIYCDQLRIQTYGQPVSVETDVDDIAPFYRDADLVLFPTLMTEGFGFTAVEAMACGKPVIWSEQPAIREATGGIGFPVPADDPDAIRELVKQYLADPAPFLEAGEAGRRFVEENYAWSDVWGRYDGVLRRLAKA